MYANDFTKVEQIEIDLTCDYCGIELETEEVLTCHLASYHMDELQFYGEVEV